MNSKAIKRQLLAAIAMVLVAAIALGSSTYAWFVASGTVKAEGMKVQAKSEGGLAIRWAGKTSELWGTTASAKMEPATSLLPASTYNLKNWTYAKAAAAKNKTADAATWDNITKKVMGDDGKTFAKENGYVVMQQFEIRSTSQNELATGLYVSGVSATPADTTGKKDIDPAIRVGVRLVSETANTFFIYGPVPNATSSYTWTDGTTKETKAVTLATVGTAGNSQSTLIAKDTDIPSAEETPIKVEIYIWYEGEDNALYSDNYAANALNVNVEFSSYGFGTTV